jgi:hypothetical protein
MSHPWLGVGVGSIVSLVPEQLDLTIVYEPEEEREREALHLTIAA